VRSFVSSSLSSVILTALALIVTACSEAGPSATESSQSTPRPASSGALTSPSTTPSEDRVTDSPGDVGPLAGETWPAGSVPIRTLLFDDGRNLWAYKLSGERTRLWRHPKAKVDEIVASPDGEELAMSVLLPARRGRDLSAVLYHLKNDGSVNAVDAVRRFMTLESPNFLTPPTRLSASPRLYWLRFGDRIDNRGRLDTSVMTSFHSGLKEVGVPLRFAEAVFAIDGYPGAAVFSLSLFRQNNVPTRLDVLVNNDYSRSTESGLTLWGNNEHRADTDVLLGTAWLSPSDYVIPMMNETHRREYSLRLFRKYCEAFGSYVIYKGPEIDIGSSRVWWPLLPAGPRKVLVLGREDVKEILRRRSKTAPWFSVDVETGAIEPTAVEWEAGAWTWVSEKVPVNPRKQTKCSEFRWTWP
jgi:hypothetical protein